MAEFYLNVRRSRHGDSSTLLPLRRPTWGPTGSLSRNMESHALRQRGAHSNYNVGLSPNTFLFIYKIVSRKLLNSEVCGNASGNGISLFTLLKLSVLLVCTNTEGPSRDRAPSYYILIITVFTSDVHGDKSPHILKRPFTYSSHKLKILLRGSTPPH